jgi:hypothetical protein
VIVGWGLVKSKLESRIERGAKSQSPDGGCGPYVNVIDGKSSNNAQTSERREGRVKSGEVLDLIYILYRETGLLSIFIMSRSCKVVIPTFLKGQSRRSPSMRNRGIGQSIPSKRRKRPFLFSFPR